MVNWKHQVRIKHLFTEKEDWVSVDKSMCAIADILDSEPSFISFDTTKFRQIPKGDDFFGPIDYANKLLAKMYDFADSRRIWIA